MSDQPASLSLALALWEIGKVSSLRREAARALEYGQRALDVATEAHYVRLQARAKLLVRWASSELDPAASEAHLNELIAPPWRGPRTGRTLDMLHFVDICARAGRDALALEKISEAMEYVEQTDERVVEAELYRMRGELLKSTNEHDAGRSFTRAIDIARHQSSRSFELRAAMSLYRFKSGLQKKDAREDVRRVFETFTEGFETGDLLDAKAILAG